jgi:serine/threonine protein kinase
VKKPTAFGKYLLLERISVGGMAEVFRAKAFGVEGFERLVAVKRILSNVAEDKEFIRMFIEEAKLSVQLNHANIAQIFDLGVVEGAYYIALEHVHGRDLRSIFERCRQLGEAMPVAQACFLAMKVCEGLDYAHNKRDQSGQELSLVHRDVSPQNILVSFEGEVKLIDFGIAKAAGTVTTQGGILKGKLGYMSPEQVRGLPVDRRSDVFSCGIVLYELLTGERLFVGESDFSMLEKVRKVEILPPSTYNRKIPDELERIVLKALSRNAGDRYQNAIDLHDELQAFVYSAGEFYARKDLAGWMKKTFAREIQEETVKLEGYRQLVPPGPGEPMPAIPRTTAAMKPAAKRKATQLGTVVNLSPPRPPASPSQPVPVLPISASIPVQSPVSAPVRAAVPVASPGRVARPHQPVANSWDDDELETQIYDHDDDNPKRKSATHASLPLQPPVPSSPAISIISGDPAEPGALSEHASPAPNGTGWITQAPTSKLSPSVMPGSVHQGNGTDASPWLFPSGSSNASSPIPPAPGFAPRARGDAAMSAGRELSAPQRLVAAAAPVPAPPLDPMSSFGAGITSRRPTRGRNLGLIAIVSAAVVVISVILVILLSGGSKPIPRPLPPPVPARPAPVIVADPDTGFDLYVTPAGVTQWKLDGELRTDRLPSRIRGIAAGPHTVQIDPPPGFLSQSQKVSVELGKAPKVEITLQPIADIVGIFESTPPGAMVSLIIDGKRQAVGPAPARAPLDPRSTYHVLFEKPGYVSINRPIAFSGGLEERVVANLEKAGPEAGGEKVDKPVKLDPGRSQRKVNRPAQDKPGAEKAGPEKVTPESSPAPDAPDAPDAPNASAPDKPAPDKPSASARPAPDPGDPKAKGGGVLVLGSKPPCEIAIDGKPTGLHTPQMEIKLSVGRHHITLTNSEFSIKETFPVDIKADTTEKMIKDYSDRLPN